ncbi:acetyl-CoA synthetase-like protein [Lentinus tigrinus ALCF2SS1-7]|uniref:acetyl-CoA synthetase-like protein n=1 Tax=Lentinus tigrinus ALCF2SS1-7 TaxID=1328758 RepID=UPI0011661213|nr:acetyl-CoA synthetase-like protein [Lentinus tigrinus ALCF2SS1-7]
MSLKDAPCYYNPTVQAWQGANSKTFTPPGLDTNLTLPELFEFHAKHSPEHPVFVYADDEQKEHVIRFPEVYRGIRKAATLTTPHYSRLADRYSKMQQGKSDGDTPIIGILANADSISFYTFKLGLMYLGLTPFPISTRNSAIAIAHFVRTLGILQMFVSGDPAMQRLARETNALLAEEGKEFELLPMPTFEDLYGPGGDDAFVPMGDVSPNKPCIILHSSGSTALPKPIKFLDKNFRKWGTFFYFGQVDLCGVRMGGQTNPMFHGMGSLMITWTVYTGVVWMMFKPSTPPILPTPELLLDSLVATHSEMVYCVPALIEAWARDPANMPRIKTLRAMIYAGAPMNKQIGDRLASEGIALIPFYGSTEIGAAVRLIPDPQTMDKSEWDYFELSPHIDVRLIPQEGQPGIFEAIAFDSPTFTPNVFNMSIEGRPAYATSDLLQQHPTKKNLFRVFGRSDDQLILSTGEKTNPAPLEAILLQDPHVSACLMFGRGRFQNGVLIQPKEPFDPSDEVKLEEYRNSIWSSIEKMNAYAPAHSRIFKEMIMATKPSKPLEYTAKGTPRRQVCIAAYVDEIDALYKKVEESSQTDLPPPRDWAPETVHEYVGDVVRKVLNNPTIQDSNDIFQYGCDSLQATWIRNTILHALRSASNVNTHDIPSDFVYANHTISKLAAYLSATYSGTGRSVDYDAERAASIERMCALLDKYSAGLKRHFPEKVAGGHGVAAETVLVTGTTGRLGSHLLEQLMKRQDVSRVYALNRESSGSVAALEKRSRDAFRQWGLDESLLLNGKVSFHAVDLSQPHFGLSEELYNEIRDSVTQIFHNAWRVDFNVALPSFEPLIAGARNLLDLALSSPLPGGPRVLFVSSISSLRNHIGSSPADETIDVDPALAYGSGYSESKWVTEQLFARAADKGLRATSVRVGQVSGDQRTGGWSTTEWVAVLVRTSQRLGCIPVKEEVSSHKFSLDSHSLRRSELYAHVAMQDLTWVPVDVVASTLQDMAMVETDERALHLVSPEPVPWNSVFIPIAERLGVPAVPYAEWLARLENSAVVASECPGVAQHDSAHNLISFFKHEGMGGASIPLSLEKALRCSKALADAQPIGREDALRYVEFWENVGYVKPPSV